MGSHYGTGTLVKRGKIWYVTYWVDGKQKQKSSGSEKIQDAKNLRDRLLGQKSNGQLPSHVVERVKCGELLDDVLAHVDATGKPATAKIWKLVIEANLRPFFGHLRAATLTTDILRSYRESRVAAKRSHATANRELSILRTALHLGRKCTPPKVAIVPYFPMTSETANARQGFLTDEQYATLRDSLPDYLKPLYVTACWTGVRKGELLSWTWDQIDFERGVIVLQADETKAGHARVVPIVKDMRKWLEWSKAEAGDDCPFVFHNCGRPIKDFRGAWETACTAAGVPDLRPHDLRRTAVRNMRRAGVPQVVRMRISGHRTDSMERRYNIVDDDDVLLAKDLMEKFGKG